jgi:CTP synthase (UTP-ammonia lyase)
MKQSPNDRFLGTPTVAAELGVDIAAEWVSTANIEPTLFSRYSGIWVAPGSPYKDTEKTLWSIQYARDNMIPCFGTCGGFQHMVIEYARNLLGVRDPLCQHRCPVSWFENLNL